MAERSDEERRAEKARRHAEWVKRWEEAVFSWTGLAHANWDVRSGGTPAQRLKRWRAPARFPGAGAVVVGEGEGAHKQASLQDY